MSWRFTVLEALVWLILARLLVLGPRLALWRGWLGALSTWPLAGLPDARDRLLARAVERAAQRLPGTSKCLPRAMALHWMIRRRARASQLVIGILPGAQRGTIDDLHAWVEVGGQVLIGQREENFLPLARFN